MAFKIKMPEFDNRKTENLSNDQLADLMTAIENDLHPVAGPMMLMALFSGLRRGEMFRLKWSDIDFKTGFIHLTETKSGEQKNIPLNVMSRELLDSLPQDSKFVFPGRGGNQRTDIVKAVNKIKEEAGLPDDFRALHGLRHVFASRLASSGKVDMFRLQRLLGHSSPEMTQRYAHLSDEAIKKASASLTNCIYPRSESEPRSQRPEQQVPPLLPVKIRSGSRTSPGSDRTRLTKISPKSEPENH